MEGIAEVGGQMQSQLVCSRRWLRLRSYMTPFLIGAVGGTAKVGVLSPNPYQLAVRQMDWGFIFAHRFVYRIFEHIHIRRTMRSEVTLPDGTEMHPRKSPDQWPRTERGRQNASSR